MWRHFCLVYMLMCSSAKAEPCSICPNADDSITLPDKMISVPGVPLVDTCGTLDSFIGLLLTEDTEECQTIRSVGSVCGCPIQNDACNLCSEGSIGHPDREVPYILREQFGAFVPTCELLEAYLHNINETNSTCSTAQTILSDYCGCSDRPTQQPGEVQCSLCPLGDVPAFPEKRLNISGFPVDTCGDLDAASILYLREGSEICSLMQSVSTYCGCPIPDNACSLCRDGSRVTLPQAQFPGISDDQFGFPATCGLVEARLHTMSDSEQQCQDAQYLGTVCGCPSVENHCVWCQGEEDVFVADRPIPQLEERFGFDLLCGEALLLQYQVEEDSEICIAAADKSWLCGCNGGHFDYFGADTVSKQAGLVWTPRISAFFSILVSAHFEWFVWERNVRLTLCFVGFSVHHARHPSK